MNETLAKSINNRIIVFGCGLLQAFATSNYTNPAQIVAALTNRSVDSVVDERYQTGKTFGMIADEAGKLIEFKQEMLELKKDELAKCVADGTMTQEQIKSSKK